MVSHVKYRRFVDPSIDLTSSLCGLCGSITMSHYFLVCSRTVWFLQPLHGFVTWTHLLKTTDVVLFSWKDSQHFSLELMTTCSINLAWGMKWFMFTLTTRKTSVYRSCWAGQATNESQGWVDNQLPPLTWSVTTRPVDWLHWHLISLGVKLHFCW